MKRLTTLLTLATLLIFTVEAPAISGFFTTIRLSGTLGFPGKVVNQFPELNKGDKAPITISFQAGDGKPRRNVMLFSGPFSTTTSSGVPVTGNGYLVGTYRSGTFYITSLQVGSSAMEPVDLKLKMSAP